MKLNKLTLHNFQLFRDCSIELDRINCFLGLNKDDSEADEISGNGAGKTTLAINAILFCLYGEVSKINLKELISKGETFAFVELEIEHKGHIYSIKREIPSDLIIKVDGQFLQKNTNTLKQQYINEVFGDYTFFKQFQTIDTSKGINVLDQGIISLRKTLMTFIEDSFSQIRKGLLAKKANCELYNIDKKPYTHYLSDKRLNCLEAEIKQIRESAKESKQEIFEIQNSITTLKSRISSLKYIIDNNKTKIIPAKEKKCPTCGKVLSIEESKTINAKTDDEINTFKVQLTALEQELPDSEDYLTLLENRNVDTEQDLLKVQNYYMKLKECFKFKDYKYTSADVAIYNEAIKELDEFAGIYINTYLSDLSVIINNLLSVVNMSVNFSADKEFMKIKNGEHEFSFDLLSSGQKTFLSAIFKLAILLQKGITNSIILCDEGLANLDLINLDKFITVCQKLPFQIFLVYQNITPRNDLKMFEVIREKGRSEVKCL